MAEINKETHDKFKLYCKQVSSQQHEIAAQLTTADTLQELTDVMYEIRDILLKIARQDGR